jgi:hypothetical protein
MSNTTDRRFFLCSGQAVIAAHLYKYPNSHVMGELCYREYKGVKVTMFARWNVSVSTCDEMPSHPDIDVLLIGDALDINCRHAACKNKKRWEIGRAAIQQIIKSYVPE